MIQNSLTNPNILFQTNSSIQKSSPTQPSQNSPSLHFNDTLNITTQSQPLIAPHNLFVLEEAPKQSTTVVLARHIHTRNHASPVQSVTIGDIQKRYAHTDFIGIEDHTSYFNSSSGSIPTVIPGAESSVKLDYTNPQKTVTNHIGILGVDKTEQKTLKIRTSAQPQTIKRKVQQADGVMILNHPGDSYLKGHLEDLVNYELSYEDASAFDAIEVFNDGHYHSSNKPDIILQWMDKTFYSRGLFPAVMSGQDDHADSHIAKTPTFTKILSTSKNEQGVMAGIREGKTYVTKQADMLIDLNLGGGEIGDDVVLSQGSHQRLNISIDHLKPASKIQVIYNGKVYSEFKPDKETFQGYLDLNIQPSNKQKQGYVYLKGYDHKGKIYMATSPIVFQVP